ncbi:hypothetical protein Tco_0865853, partial [Tanacetum coccineum]
MDTYLFRAALVKKVKNWLPKEEEEKKDKVEEEEPKLTWYQLASNPNRLKFLVLLFGVP